MENGDMDVDMDIDLGPIDGGAPQVNKLIRLILLYSVARLTMVVRHPIREIQVTFSLLVTASTLVTYQLSLPSMRPHKRFTFEAWTTSQQRISKPFPQSIFLPGLHFASSGSMIRPQS